jgi:hypothetical protein
LDRGRSSSFLASTNGMSDILLRHPASDNGDAKRLSLTMAIAPGA